MIDIVEVNRYYRPRSEKGAVDSNRGVTVMFVINYKERTLTANWSVCIGDNFCKATGIQYAQACEWPIVTPLQGPIISGESVKLVDMLLQKVDIILGEVPADSKNSKMRHDVSRLKNELVASNR